MIWRFRLRCNDHTHSARRPSARILCSLCSFWICYLHTCSDDNRRANINEFALLENGAKFASYSEMGSVRRSQQVLLRWLFDVGSAHRRLLFHRVSHHVHQYAVFCIRVSMHLVSIQFHRTMLIELLFRYYVQLSVCILSLCQFVVEIVVSSIIDTKRIKCNQSQHIAHY